MDEYADTNALTEVILSILANPRRRIVIRYLGETEPAELKEIAAVIAKIEDTSEKSAYTSLYQTHAPKLKRTDIIQRANGTRSIEQGPNYPRAKLILDYCDQL